MHLQCCSSGCYAGNKLQLIFDLLFLHCNASHLVSLLSDSNFAAKFSKIRQKLVLTTQVMLAKLGWSQKKSPDKVVNPNKANPVKARRGEFTQGVTAEKYVRSFLWLTFSIDVIHQGNSLRFHARCTACHTLFSAASTC